MAGVTGLPIVQFGRGKKWIGMGVLGFVLAAGVGVGVVKGGKPGGTIVFVLTDDEAMAEVMTVVSVVAAADEVSAVEVMTVVDALPGAGLAAT